MYKIKEAVIVEGVYDKIKLSGFLDGIILATHGFSVYHDEELVQTIKRIAEETGVVILTDSDSAGFRIRSFIKQKLPPEQVKHAYVPDIEGVERRKSKASAEGLLGVEGMSEEIIIRALKEAGCTIDSCAGEKKQSRGITKADMYRLGLTGSTDSCARREYVSNVLGMPSKLSSNMLLDVLDRLISLEELEDIVKNAQNNQ